MKIVTKKQLRLDELIKRGIDEDWHSFQITSNDGVDVYFTSDRRFLICDEKHISLDELFTVEAEEELTEETVFSNMLIVVQDPETNEKSVLWRIEHNIELSRSRYGKEMLTISAVDEDGKPTLIWSKDAGIPTEGTFKI